MGSAASDDPPDDAVQLPPPLPLPLRQPWRRRAGGAVALSVLLALPVAQFAVDRLGLRLLADPGWRLALALTLAPLVEEFILRSLLQRGLQQALQRRGWRAPIAMGTAAAVAAVTFAAAHLGGWTLPALWRCSAWLLPGAALAVAWCWRRRTADCVLLHAWFNAALWWASSATA